MQVLRATGGGGGGEPGRVGVSVTPLRPPPGTRLLRPLARRMLFTSPARQVRWRKRSDTCGMKGGPEERGKGRRAGRAGARGGGGGGAGASSKGAGARREVTRAGGGEWGACRECSSRSSELRSRQVRKSSQDFPAGGENRGRDLWHPLGRKVRLTLSKGLEVAPPAAPPPHTPPQRCVRRSCGCNLSIREGVTRGESGQTRWLAYSKTH